jgi:hypothetical protein
MSDLSAAGEGWVRVVSQGPMHTPESGSFTQVGRVAVFVLALAAVATHALLACSKEAPAAVEPESTVAASRAAGEPAPAAAAPAAQAPAQADEGEPTGAVPAADKKFSEATFELEMKPKGDYTAGQSAEVEVVLDAKGAYKPNDKYPFKLKLEDSEGVAYPDKIIKKDAVKLDGKRAVMTVKFTPANKGKKRIAGQFAFSICTDERCLIERRDLALDVNVN